MNNLLTGLQENQIQLETAQKLFKDDYSSNPDQLDTLHKIIKSAEREFN